MYSSHAVEVIAVKCPSCGAKTKAQPGKPTLVCEYCGTESLVQRREGVLERPAKVEGGADQLPVATQPHSAAWSIAVLVFFAVVFGGPVLGVLYHLLGMRWTGVRQVMLADVDSNGTADAIGFAQTGGDSTWIVALDGESGDKIWATSTIGDYGDVIGGATAIVGDTVIYAWDGGELLGFSAQTGESKWEAAAPPEKIREICERPDGVAVLELADDTVLFLRLADGSTETLDAPPDCKPVWNDRREHAPDVEVRDSVHLLVGALRADRVFRKPGGPWVAFGRKAKGSGVIMLAATTESLESEDHGTRDLAATWEATVAAKDALKSNLSGAELALSDSAVFAAYEPNDELPRLTGLDLDDGDRRFDVEIDRDAPLVGVSTADGRVYVALWGTLLVYDAKSGEELYKVGI